MEPAALDEGSTAESVVNGYRTQQQQQQRRASASAAAKQQQQQASPLLVRFSTTEEVRTRDSGAIKRKHQPAACVYCILCVYMVVTSKKCGQLVTGGGDYVYS